MDWFAILSKGFNAMMDEAFTPQSFKTGEAFEVYVRRFLFIKQWYDLLERTHGYTMNHKDYVKSSLKPDFKFYDKYTKRIFYVEAKFRTTEYNGKIYWCNDIQLSRYREYNKQIPVFVIIGVGGNPKCPNFLSLISLNHAKYTGLFPSVLKKYEIQLNKPISSRILWNS